VNGARPIDELEQRQIVERPHFGQRQVVPRSHGAPSTIPDLTCPGSCEGELRACRRCFFFCSGNYYRSRYAEIVFNTLARASKDRLARHVRGPFAPSTSPTTQALSRPSFSTSRTIADGGARAHSRPARRYQARSRRRAGHRCVKESEHRTILAARFPEFVDRVVYWNIHDVDVASPADNPARARKGGRRALQTLSPSGPLRDR